MAINVALAVNKTIQNDVWRRYRVPSHSGAKAVYESVYNRQQLPQLTHFTEYRADQLFPSPLLRCRRLSVSIDSKESRVYSSTTFDCPHYDHPSATKKFTAYPHLVKTPCLSAEVFDLERIPFGALRDADFMLSTSRLSMSYIAFMLRVCYPRCGAIQAMKICDVGTMSRFYNNSEHVQVAAPWPTSREEGYAIRQRFRDIPWVDGELFLTIDAPVVHKTDCYIVVEGVETPWHYDPYTGASAL